LKYIFAGSHVSPEILEHKREVLLKSLVGTYSDDHLFALTQAHHTWQHYNLMIEQCGKAMEKLLDTMTATMEDVTVKTSANLFAIIRHK
jgi:hypothetical protein